ncbi:class F sortase [Streptomyces gamaensis]|uniref:Class F sortase n=1 Tax=Streptomyces gamaensis TaxID=1763542 RepID=A0ABW0YXZ9_9ACTN
MSRSRPSLSVLALPALLASVLGAVLAGCSLGGERPAASATPASPEEPAGVSIPSIGVRSQLLRLGLNKDATVQVPPPEKGKTAGWYTGGAVPGERGPAVIIGHDDGPDGQAVFHELHRLGKGDVVDVERGDGTVLHFTVTGTEKVAKNSFPAKKVYGDTTERALRLVTCACELDANGHPVRSLIVYATLKS